MHFFSLTCTELSAAPSCRQPAGAAALIHDALSRAAAEIKTRRWSLPQSGGWKLHAASRLHQGWWTTRPTGSSRWSEHRHTPSSRWVLVFFPNILFSLRFVAKHSFVMANDRQLHVEQAKEITNAKSCNKQFKPNANLNVFFIHLKSVCEETEEIFTGIQTQGYTLFCRVMKFGPIIKYNFKYFQIYKLKPHFKKNLLLPHWSLRHTGCH